ncbi:MAG TPA: lytic murein transglycosylase [Solirubrobacteraceae bacterium]|jgi:hypothetical protein|nr:lytic murein transglycosylase [Solirubrobacteraceae bacterium]
MSAPRRWARRAMLSMLAGGGLTAAGFGGPLAGGAGAETSTTTATTTEDQTPPVTETTPQAPTTTQPGGGGSGGSSETTTSTTGGGSGAGATGASGASASGEGAGTTATTPTAPSTATTPSAPAPSADGEPPTVVVQHSQPTTAGRRHGSSVAGSGKGSAEKGAGGNGNGEGAAKNGAATTPANGPNGVAPAPQTAGEEAGVLATLLTGSTVSAQALDFYRIPLFLLPVYQAAAFQYDVPWQILAAINEIETDYGTDLSVSTAGALGWMQFMPGTWLQYGVDATNAGYADPYNPVDAIFAAARYLHAAGVSHNLRAAIFSYNHSQEYVESVLLRAKLVASYPSSVIATLTGLVDGRAPTAGAHLAPGAAASLSAPSSEAAAGTGASSATAGAVPAPLAPTPAAAASAVAPTTGAQSSSAASGGDGKPAHADSAAKAATTPGSTPAPSPQAAAAHARALANAPAKPSQLAELLGKPDAPVVAVEDGRIERIGRSRTLGRYLVLRDVYGDLFTYAGLGSVAARYRPAVPHVPVAGASGAAAPAGAGAGGGGPEPTDDPAPTQAASAGRQTPLTLKVKAHVAQAPAQATPASEPEGENVPAGMGRVRLFAHPANPLAQAAAHSAPTAGGWARLRTGSIVAKGTVLGHLYTPAGATAGQLRFAVRPSGDNGTIDPRPLLENWRQLGSALHPKGSKSADALVGATAAAALSMSKAQLERAVLADPGIQLDGCGRRDVAAGAVDARVLAALVFLSRSGLQPTVGGLRCPATPASGLSAIAGSGVAAVAARQAAAHTRGLALNITAINDIPIAGHQGQGSVADAAIRTLLMLHGRFAPHRIVSLMKYPQAPTTEALATAAEHIHVEYAPAAAAAVHAHAAAAGPSAAAPLAASGQLSGAQWGQLIQRIGALPKPTVSLIPSSSAIRDPQAAPTNRGLGARGLAGGG